MNHADSSPRVEQGATLPASEAKHRPGTRDYGDIFIVGRNPGDEKPCVRYSSTTPHAGNEVSVMTNYLELERAQRLRNVTISPHAVGALIVASPNVSVWRLVRGWFKQRALARAAIAKAPPVGSAASVPSNEKETGGAA